MSKKYNLGSNSDMRRFMKDLEKQIYSNAEQQIYSQTYAVDCPHCHNKVSVKPGSSLCPFCRNQIKLNLNIKYE